MDGANGMFREGPTAMSSFACAASGGRLFVFGGRDSLGAGFGVEGFGFRICLEVCASVASDAGFYG